MMRRVPAKRGMRVTYSGRSAKPPIGGKILGASGGYLRIRLDDGSEGNFHPTWKLQYHTDDGGED